MRFARLLPGLLLLALLFAAPAAAAECPGADLAPGADRIAVRAAVVCLSNEERTSRGRKALVPEGRLESAAQRYSEQLVRERFFGHVSPTGQELADRVVQYSDWERVGENLAWGEGSLGTPRAIVAGWMASPAHRENLLSRKFTEVGIGAANGTPLASLRPAATFTAEYGVRDSDEAPHPIEGAEARRTTSPSCRKGFTRRSVRAHGKRVLRCVSKR